MDPKKTDLMIASGWAVLKNLSNDTGSLISSPSVTKVAITPVKYGMWGHWYRTWSNSVKSLKVLMAHCLLFANVSR